MCIRDRSYTTFAYGKPSADKKTMTVDDTISFTVNVKNTGTREGQEVVQLYISDKKSSLPRPVKELKGFQKVKLAPGEEKACLLYTSLVTTNVCLKIFFVMNGVLMAL